MKITIDTNAIVNGVKSMSSKVVDSVKSMTNKRVRIVDISKGVKKGKKK